MSDPKVIEGELVRMDYQTFDNIIFRKCKIVYAGGQPPILTGQTVIEECEIILDGPALNTAMYLGTLAHGGDAGLVVHGLLGLKNWGPKDAG